MRRLPALITVGAAGRRRPGGPVRGRRRRGRRVRRHVRGDRRRDGRLPVAVVRPGDRAHVGAVVGEPGRRRSLRSLGDGRAVVVRVRVRRPVVASASGDFVASGDSFATGVSVASGGWPRRSRRGHPRAPGRSSRKRQRLASGHEWSLGGDFSPPAAKTAVSDRAIAASAATMLLVRCMGWGSPVAMRPFAAHLRERRPSGFR